MRRNIVLVGLICAAWFGDAIGQHAMSSFSVPASLRIPLFTQRSPEWCWAACTQMAMHYFRGLDSAAPLLDQCELARRYALSQIGGLGLDSSAARTLRDSIRGLYCTADSVPDVLVVPGYPFTPPMSYYDVFQPSSLTWNELTSIFERQRLVIFTWSWFSMEQLYYDSGGRGSHVMLAEGCSVMPSAPQYHWVSVNDPWPVDSTLDVGRHAQILFNNVRHSPGSANPTEAIVWVGAGPFYSVGKKVGK